MLVTNGHVDASSSGKNVEHDGDVFNDWDKSTPNSDLFVEISKLLIFSKQKYHFHSFLRVHFLLRRSIVYIFCS